MKAILGRSIVLTLAFLLSAPLVLSAATDPASGEAAAIAKLRDRYRRLELSRGVDEGRSLVIQFPASTELRAWFVSNLAAVDRPAAERASRELRYAHPSDPWTWFAAVVTDLYSERDVVDADRSSEKMLSLYRGADDEVFRLYSRILRERLEYDEAMKFLAGKTEPWALAERALVIDARAWRDPKLIDDALAAFAEAERAGPDDPRVWHDHAMSLWSRKRGAEAIPLLRRAVALATESIVIRGDYWRALAASSDATPEARKATVEADVESLLSHAHSPDVLYAAQRQYHDLEDEAKASATERQLLEEYPDSQQAEWVVYNRADRYSRENSRKRNDPAVTAQIRSHWQDFIDYPFHPSDVYLGQAYFHLLLSSDDDPPIQSGPFLEWVDGTLAYSDPQRVSLTVAEHLATRGLRLADAERLAREGVRNALVPLIRDKAALTKEDYERGSKVARGRAHLTLGWVLLARHRNTGAGTELKLAFSLMPADPRSAHHLGKWYEATGALSKAEDTYATGMAHEKDEGGTNRKALRDLYVKRHGSEEGLDSYVAAIRDGAASKQKRLVLASRITPARAPRSPFSLETLAGERISLASLQGKVAVVKFWGVWCQPCVSELPEFQKLVDQYGGDAKVSIVTIDTDKDPSVPKSFMEKNHYSFPVLFDDGWVSSASGVAAFPTTWFLAPDGKVAFEKKGVSPRLVDEFTWRIEALKTGGR